MSILRTLVFIPVFYTISVFVILTSILALPFGERGVQQVAVWWVSYHRWCTRNILGITIKVEGTVDQGPFLYAVRHESFFEAIDLPVLFDRPAPFAKRELFSIPVWGWAARSYGCIPVDRDGGAKALRQMVTAAKALSDQGRPLIIFPEGTRMPHGTPGKLRSGFAGLYKLLKLPVVPVAVNSGPLYAGAIKRPGTVTYRFGDPIPPGLPRAEVEKRVSEAINALNQDAPSPVQADQID